MKKLLAGVAVIGLLATPAMADELPKTELNVVGTWSNLNLYRQFEKPFWEERITEASNGAITATVQGFNEMGLRGPEIVRLMEQGVIDMGATILGYLAADDPRNEAIDLAGLSPDANTARRVSEAYKPTLAQMYNDEYDIKLLSIWPYSAQVLFCNRPLNSLADLRGAKVRTANRTLAEFMEAVGAEGVTMAFSEVVPAMQQGVMDCGITGAMSGYSAGWHEVATHLYTLPVGWSQVIVAVSNNKWNSLDPKVQELIIEELARLEDEVWRGAEEETMHGFACNTGGECPFGEPASMTLVEVSFEDEIMLKEILRESVLPKWAARAGADAAAVWSEEVGYIVDLEAVAN